MNYRTLSVVLLESIVFEALVARLGIAFQVAFSVENKKGRRIAQAQAGKFDIAVIDRVDELGDFLSDENYVIDIVIKSDELFGVEFEDLVRKSLGAAEIKWERGVWSRLSRSEQMRTISP